mmetsp:Transcript_10495/g.30479  ORF Transcript_10495/g.30479 Transcript_10495/m.30479 type:complete len:133 (+) Transcript_10495:91-489(+)
MPDKRRSEAKADEPPAKKSATTSGGAAPAVKAKKMLCMRYTYIEGMLEKRSPYRAEHLVKAAKLSEAGCVFMAGAFNDPCDGAVFFLDGDKITREELEKWADEDPYVKNGLVTKRTICDYMAVVGSLVEQLV